MKLLQTDQHTLDYLTQIVKETSMDYVYYFFDRHGHLPIVRIIDKNNSSKSIQFEFNKKTISLNLFGTNKILSEEVIDQDSFPRHDQGVFFNKLFDILQERCYQDLQIQKNKTLVGKTILEHLNGFLYQFIK